MKYLRMFFNFIIETLSNNKGKAPIVVKPVEPIPEIPTREEVEQFPKRKLVQVEDNKNDGNPSRPDWTYLIATAKIDQDKKDAVFKVAREQIAHWARYKNMETATGVPAGVIADIFQKECSLDFTKCLHNGQKIIGTNKKTTWVPAGRGPFGTWEESVMDALGMKNSIFPDGPNWNKYYDHKGWTTVNILKFHQRYNGLGHQNKGLEYTPYDWAYTNHHDETGNYVSDGKYKSSAEIKSPGTMATMLAREELGFV
jgi:lysozyme family protein